jgi:hypothetical protein
MSKMFTVSLIGLVGLGIAVTGCGGGDRDRGFGLTWGLRLIGGGDQGITCDEAGTPTVMLQTDGANNVHSEDTFPCAGGSGVSRVLPRGTYQVTVALLNGAGQTVSGTRATAVLDRGGVTPLPPLTFDIQAFNLTWTLARGSTGISCRDANAATVRLITLFGNDPPVNYDFPCFDKDVGTNGSTTAVPIGTYSLRVQLLDPAGNLLSEVPAMTFPVSATAPADLPPITFQLR